MSKGKPNCYECKWRRNIRGDCHSECKHPKAFLTMARSLGRQQIPDDQILTIEGSAHGARNGWFAWPINFDPIWLESCNGFEAITNDKA